MTPAQVGQRELECHEECSMRPRGISRGTMSASLIRSRLRASLLPDGSALEFTASLPSRQRRSCLYAAFKWLIDHGCIHALAVTGSRLPWDAFPRLPRSVPHALLAGGLSDDPRWCANPTDWTEPLFLMGVVPTCNSVRYDKTRSRASRSWHLEIMK
jgi:hypothetical protein